DEMATATLPAAQSIIFWWRHDKPAQLQAALKNNYPVVLCPRIPFYFDFVQDSSHNVGRKWAGTIAALKDVYTFDASKFVSDNQKPLVLGVQANVWTEHMKTEQRLDYMIFPRISALAETAWSSKGKNYSDFLNRLKNHLKLYKQDGIYYFNPLQALKYSEPEL
ncbi:MAG TPA: family 20 glycosylhydrolase, partial [Niabella sp.]|nr:family 20 glycosylhydrolase [Niabella sp.]